MKFPKLNVEIYQFPTTGKLRDAYKWAERIGRVCYHSEDNITSKSYASFIKGAIESKHYNVIEHISVYLTIPIKEFYKYADIINKNSFLIRGVIKDDKAYFTTNLRFLLEHKELLPLLEYNSKPTEYHPKRITFKIENTSIQVGREVMRHRSFCYTQESTRYCNYTKEKFGSEVSFYLNASIGAQVEDEKSLQCVYSDLPNKDVILIETYKMLEVAYNSMIKAGATPQEAAAILPLGLTTTYYMTGFQEDYWHFFSLRYMESTGKVLPALKEMTSLMYPLFLDLIDKKINPNENAVSGIQKALKRNNNECPCSSNTSVDKECPCSNMREKNECCCNLYVNK